MKLNNTAKHRAKILAMVPCDVCSVKTSGTRCAYCLSLSETALAAFKEAIANLKSKGP